MKILLVGSGGREHALAWKIAQSPLCKKLYCAPGNPGIAAHAECIDIAVDDIERIVQFATQNDIDLVVVGPELPLVLGLADALKEIGIAVFGPSKAGAQLEGSKAFTKTLCDRYNIPTAAYGRFTDIEKATIFLQEKGARVVIKADGLAAGKGVIIPETLEEAVAAAEDMLLGTSLGDAGAEIVIEEFLDGEELSFFAICDGQNAIPFTSAQDHKRVGDGDTGPNTGGMGAYSPAHLMTPDLQQKIMDRIIDPTVRGMAEQGMPFKGVLFAGIMVVGNDPYLIEYNVRFGDPECQVMIPRLNDDLVAILLAAANSDLSTFSQGFQWSNNHALGVVMAASGYPGPYKKGGVITNLDVAEKQANAKIFHAGTILKDGSLTANGGRVLTVTATSGSISEAQQKAYKAVSLIDWQDGFCRKDIGWRAIAAAKDKAA